MDYVDLECKNIKENYNKINDFTYKYIKCNRRDIVTIGDIEGLNIETDSDIVFKIRILNNHSIYTVYNKWFFSCPNCRCYIVENENGRIYLAKNFKELNKDEEIRYIKLRDKYECETGKKLINFPILYSMYKVTDNGVYIENIKNSFTEFDLNNVISENCIPYKYNVGGNYSFKYLIMSMIEFK